MILFFPCNHKKRSDKLIKRAQRERPGSSLFFCVFVYTSKMRQSLRCCAFLKPLRIIYAAVFKKCARLDLNAFSSYKRIFREKQLSKYLIKLKIYDIVLTNVI